NLLLFLWLFRRDIPSRFPVDALEYTGETPAASDPAARASAQRRLAECLIILVLLLAGIAAAPFFGWELWELAVAGAVVLTVHGALRGYVHPRELTRGISWDLMPFVFSLFLVLRGVGNSGLTEVFSSVLADEGAGGSFWGLLVIAATTALGSNLINNLPMVLVAADSLTAPVASGQVSLASVYAVLLGTNLGPNLTVIGSLATMLALSIIGSKGMRVSGVQYLKVGAVTVPLLLLGSALGLWLALRG
ncbi:MAG TPA: ArsB/NhaD family transporter, partial [Limnochordales bacterium]